jgi:hypothetical protein
MLCGNRNNVINHCDLDEGHEGAHEDKRRGSAWIKPELGRIKKVTISTVIIATEGSQEVKEVTLKASKKTAKTTVQASKWTLGKTVKASKLTADKCIFPVWNGTKGATVKVVSKVKSTK